MRKYKKTSFERSHLEWQIVQAIKDSDLSFEEFAKKMGTSRANISRDLTTIGLNRASICRVKKMAEILDMEFIPILIPKSGNFKRFKFSVGVGEETRTLDLKLAKPKTESPAR